ncbi:MAG: hypothetical protein GXP13_08655 [Gammaproteobacteria bacterium]|nr:hypothetical protein [Gammaproteobacteria bacterium]
MEVAAYPVPYISPRTPQLVDVKSSNGSKSDLQSRQSQGREPSERILQGEVLGNPAKSRNASSSERYTFEQRARREKPDLSSLAPQAQRAIFSYLDNIEGSTLSYDSRSLIDVYA